MNKVQVYRTLLIYSFVTLTFPIHAQPIPEEMNSFSRKAYNKLPFSVEADTNLKRNGKLTQFLEDAKGVADKYGVSDSIGFRLLHRHEDLTKGKIMVEKFGNWKSQPALITSAEDKAERKVYPASWSCEKDELNVFEYSSDPNVKRLAKLLGKNLSFFKDMKEVLERHDLQGILAPAVLTRESFVHFDSTQVLYELIQPQPYASILVNKSLEEVEAIKASEGNLVQTTWPVGGKTQFPVLCVTYCKQSEEDYKWHEFIHPG